MLRSSEMETQPVVAGGYVGLWPRSQKSNSASSRKQKMGISCILTILLLGFTLEKTLAVVHKEKCMRMFLAVSILMAWKVGGRT